MKINIELGLHNNKIIFDFSDSSLWLFMDKLIGRVLGERYTSSRHSIDLHKLTGSDNLGIKYKEFISQVRKKTPEAFETSSLKLSDDKLTIFNQMIDLINEYEKDQIMLEKNFIDAMKTPISELNEKLFSDSFKAYNFQKKTSKKNVCF